MKIDLLEKLAAYLAALPEDYEHFDMRTFLSSYGAEAIGYAMCQLGEVPCGSVACALGHGPAADVCFLPEEIRCGSPNWNAYAARLVEGTETSIGSNSLYMWMFFDDWSDVDPTPHGAAKRIRYAIENGGPPEGFHLPHKKWMKHYAAH